MKLAKIIELLDAEVSGQEVDLQKEIIYAFSCDLMSDALMLAKSIQQNEEIPGVLITGLMTEQSIRTAEMLDIATIIYVRDKKPTKALLDRANDCGITLISTAKGMYSAGGTLYANGLIGYDG